MSWRAHLVLKVGVLDYKKYEGNVKLKYTDSHTHGASMLQMSAITLRKLKCTTYTHLEETRQNRGVGKKLKLF